MPVELRPAEHWDAKCKCFAVIVDGRKIGHVEQFHPEFERGPRGRPYVTMRWRAKRPYWAAFWPGSGNGYSLPYATRKRAVENVIAADARRQADQ